MTTHAHAFLGRYFEWGGNSPPGPFRSFATRVGEKPSRFSTNRLTPDCNLARDGRRSIPPLDHCIGRGALRGCFFRSFTVSLAFTIIERLGSFLSPFSGSTFRRCRANAFAIPFMLWAAVLLPFLRRLQRFTILAQCSTASHPAALVACCLTVTRIGLSPTSSR